MQRDDCARFEEGLLSGAEIGDDLHQHATSCPRCRALAEIASLRAPRVESAEGDPQLTSARAAARTTAVARAARYERRRRLIPLLIGIAGYLLGAIGLTVACFSPTPPVAAAAGEIPLPSVALSLPPPSPTAILVACAISLAWIVGLVLIAGRRQTEGNGVATWNI